MSRLGRKIKLALAGLVGGFAFACRAASPEAPPMGPRPEPVAPGPGPTAPVPGAPAPIDQTPPTPADAGVSSVQSIDPVIIGAAAPKPKPIDAGVPDASPPPPPPAPAPTDAGVPLPPVPDGGLPPDASRRAD